MPEQFDLSLDEFGIDQEELYKIFRRLEKESDLIKVAKDFHIKTKLLLEKYRVWLEHTTQAYTNSTANRIFSEEEEEVLMKNLWNNKNFRSKEQLFSDSVVHRLAQQFHKKVSRYRSVRPFKASIGWIIDFRRRYHIKFINNKCFYRQWEVITPA